MLNQINVSKNDYPHLINIYATQQNTTHRAHYDHHVKNTKMKCK